ncbi:J domain-containing protein [uncultured Alsobacter sp.]|uniref:J domain-containing protein n=1 Tax=uncultured Alsobacter sp. TaxID=1748258 RepID=UPI0025CF7F4A|nr:J domain-containing protein [uncultured Alsobacter sp.]
MNLNSRIFDRIRSRPRRAEDARASVDAPGCEHPGCTAKGEHRAPKGRGQEGQYWRFCIDHVRAYNQSYNYFSGMTDDAIARYQKEAIVGHRPTWSMGTHGPGAKPAAAEPSGEFVYNDPFGVFRAAGFAGRAAPEPEGRRPGVGPVARRAYETLGLEETADAAAVKARYKALVKQVHPDANGGDRSLEDRLREIINAYNTLKAAGLA